MKKTTKFLFACCSIILSVSCGLKPIPSEHHLVRMDKEKISLNDLGNGTALIFNDVNNFWYPSDLSSKINIQLDGKNLGQLRAKDFVIVRLENGTHSFRLTHWDVINMKSDHQITVTDSVKVISVKPTIISNDLEIVNQLPENWGLYNFMDSESAIEQMGIEKKLNIVFQGGFGYRVGRVAEDNPEFMKDYIRNTKLGISLGLDVSYFLQPKWGFGIKYNRYSASGVLNDIVVTNYDGSEASGNLTENITLDFTGVSYVNKFSFRNPDHIIYSGITQGYMNYNNNVVLANRQYELKGATYGLAIDLGYNYAISKHFSLGTQATFIGAVLKNIHKYETGMKTTSEVKENLSRIDLNAGVRYRI